MDDTQHTPHVSTTEAPNHVSPYMEVFRRLGPAGPLAIIAATIPAILGFAVAGSLYWITPVRDWLHLHMAAGLLIYILGFTVLGGMAILPTWAHSVLGGSAFGFRIGCPAAIASVLGGSIVGYVVGRRAAGQRVVRLLEEHPKTRAVYNSLLRSGFGKSLLIVTLIRLPPSSPYAVTNLALSAARVNPIVYILGTVLGIAPRTAIVVYFASRLSHLSFHDPHRGLTIAITIAATVIVLSILGYFANQAIAQVTASHRTPSNAQDAAV